MCYTDHDTVHQMKGDVGMLYHSHQVKNLIFFQRQKHGILSNENHRWKGLFFDGKKDEGMDNNDSSTLLL